MPETFCWLKVAGLFVCNVVVDEMKFSYIILPVLGEASGKWREEEAEFI